MKISELIKILQEYEEKEGDLPVIVSTDDEGRREKIRKEFIVIDYAIDFSVSLAPEKVLNIHDI